MKLREKDGEEFNQFLSWHLKRIQKQYGIIERKLPQHLNWMFYNQQKDIIIDSFSCYYS